MTTDLERLKVWMKANGHDSKSLSKALGYYRDAAKNILNGTLPINQSFKCRFLSISESLPFELFGINLSDGWRESEIYPAQYDAHLAVAKARRRDELPPASTYKCHGCNNQARRYHHQSYHPDDHLCIVPLCDSCHSKAHWGSLNITFGVVPTSVGIIRISIASL